MFVSVYNSKSFKRLKSKWYKKLATSGFNDVEDTTREASHTTNTFLKRWDSVYFRIRHSIQSADSITTYYRHCGLFLHSHTFNSSKERLIFWMHSKGFSLRDTAQYLNLSHESIAKILRPLIILMKEFNYDDED